MTQSGILVGPEDPNSRSGVGFSVAPSPESGMNREQRSEPQVAVINRSSTITQESNSAGGDIVGGDKVTNVYQAPASHTPSSRLLKLLVRLHEEVKGDVTVSTILDELRRFQEPISKNTRSLEAKLTAGGRADLIDYALWAKEAFAKKLTRFSFFESAQDLHSLVLARVCSTFTHQIRPLLLGGAARTHVEASIQQAIIDPLVTDLSEPPLRYGDTEVFGMLYFLTGNCYVEWQ